MPLRPGMKIQIQNLEIVSGIILLRPKNVLWVGGSHESDAKRHEEV